MPDDKVPDEKSPDDKKIKAKGSDPEPAVGALLVGAVVGVGPIGEVVPTGSDTVVPRPWPTGSITLDAGTDVTQKLNEAVPAFGNVLTAVGNAVAASQQALDKSFVDAVKKLNDTKIKVVTQVIEELNEDGVPDPTKTQLITNEVSVLQYFAPPSLVWDRVGISMDLSVGAFQAEQGVQFSKQQENTSAGGSYAWSFGGWFDFQHSSSDQSVQTNNQQNIAWSSGQCQIDAHLVGSSSGRLPVAASVTKGPQIYVTQGAISEQKTGDVVSSRSVEMLIELRKTSGEAMNQGVPIVLNSGGLLASFANGSSTDNNGKVRVTLTRNLATGSPGFQKFQGSVILKNLTQSFALTL